MERNARWTRALLMRLVRITVANASIVHFYYRPMGHHRSSVRFAGQAGLEILQLFGTVNLRPVLNLRLLNRAKVELEYSTIHFNQPDPDKLRGRCDECNARGVRTNCHGCKGFLCVKCHIPFHDKLLKNLKAIQTTNTRTN